MNYRPDIDGLRAIAVGSVILYHFDVWPFTGGFVGVDVFFVISGYLITNLIVKEINAGEFSFGNFYIRRARRLLPAFFVVLAITFYFGVLVFGAKDLKALGESTMYAIFSLSNFHFWSIADYFDTSTKLKPLLHTWSLSVEEQFYLFWPLTIVLLFRLPRLVAPIVLALMSISSLALAVFWIRSGDGVTAFYLLPARIVEFGFGAALVWIPRFVVPAFYREMALVSGLGMILASVLLYTEETPFPGFASLLPCLGAALAIFGGMAPMSGIILRNPVAVWIGKTSYSSYLIHWPVVVFASFMSPPGVFPWWKTTLLIGITFGLAWMLYEFVEQPFRRRRWRFSWAAATGILAALAIVLPAGSAWSSNGWGSRVPPERKKIAQVGGMRSSCGRTNPSVSKKIFYCQKWSKKPRDIIVYGDSHAMHLFSGVASSFEAEANIYAMFFGGCAPQVGNTSFTWRVPSQDCVRHNKRMMNVLKKWRPSTVIVSNAARGDPEEMAQATNELIRRIAAFGHEVYYIGDTVRPGVFLDRCIAVPDYLLDDKSMETRCAGDPSFRQNLLAYNKTMAQIIPDYIDISAVQCPDGKCSYFLDGKPMFIDDHHLSAHASRFIIRSIRTKLMQKPH
ncbi:acyltransferase family protein [Aquibium sp. LZ166]|uniref:Acyltransferase family protein n=1 Tax=Aquibium pacificus TaxID=3153579 RepID=A0ABV3SE98_9HYPH